MKAIFQLQIIHQPNHELPPFMSWRHVLKLLIGADSGKTLLDANLPQHDLTRWIFKNEGAIRNENLPEFLAQRLAPRCIADAMGKFDDAPLPDPDDFLEADVFDDYRERHLISYGVHGVRIPDYYIGKFDGRHEISWFPANGDAQWCEVDIESLFATARQAVASLNKPNAVEIAPD